VRGEEAARVTIRRGRGRRKRRREGGGEKDGKEKKETR